MKFLLFPFCCALLGSSQCCDGVLEAQGKC